MQADEELAKTIAVTLEGNIVHYVMKVAHPEAEDSTRQAQLAAAQIMVHFDADKSRMLKALVDLTPLKDARYLSGGARKEYIQLMSLEQLEKLAFVVPSKFIRFLTSFFTQSSDSWDRVQWFSNEAEARAWLGQV